MKDEGCAETTKTFEDKIERNSKNKNSKFDFSFASANCASFV